MLLCSFRGEACIKQNWTYYIQPGRDDLLLEGKRSTACSHPSPTSVVLPGLEQLISLPEGNLRKKKGNRKRKTNFHENFISSLLQNIPEG